MRAFAKTQGALAVSKIGEGATNGPVLCELDGCQRIALQRVTMAGHPAGFLCSKCARMWLRRWSELTIEPDPPVLARAA